MVRLRDALRERLAGERVPCCRSHGDFTPWNLLVRGGRLAAFDWEFSEPRAPALFDLLHFHVQTGVLVRHVDAPRLLRELDVLAAGAARTLFAPAGPPPVSMAALAGLYVLHVATLDDEVHRIERPPFVQVEWLRSARRELAELLADRLRAEAGGADAEVRAA